MKALILNSGIGHRMGDLTRNQPKCMTDIGAGYTILSRQLTQLAAAGVREVVITTGPFEEALKAACARLEPAAGCGFCAQPRICKHQLYREHPFGRTAFARARCAAAAWRLGARKNSVLADLLQSPKSAMAVDSTLPLPEKDFKALLRDGCIVAVGVNLSGAECGLPTRLPLACAGF